MSSTTATTGTNRTPTESVAPSTTDVAKREKLPQGLMPPGLARIHDRA